MNISDESWLTHYFRNEKFSGKYPEITEEDTVYKIIRIIDKLRKKKGI